MEVIVEFILRDTADSLVVWIHADIPCIVESREDTHLRELCHTGEEDEAQVCVGSLESGEEGLQFLAVVVFETHHAAVFLKGNTGVHHIKQWFVVFVDKDYARLTRLLVRVLQQIGKAVTQQTLVALAILFFSFFDKIVQGQMKRSGIDKLLSVEVNLKHRIFRPVLLQLFHLQSLKEVLTALEIILQGRDKQRLTETAGTAEEIDSLTACQLIDQAGLVNVYHIAINNFGKVLDADGI